MDYTIPTTKKGLHDTLRQLYVYYRTQRRTVSAPYVPVSLPRISYTKKTEAELKEIATKLLKAKHTKEIREKKEEYQKLYDAYVLQKEKLTKSYNKSRLEVEKSYDESVEKVNVEATKKGLMQSSIVASELAYLSDKRVEKLLDLKDEYDYNKSLIDAKIDSINQKISNVSEMLLEEHTQEITAKTYELQLEEEKTIQNIEKQNADIELKEVNINAQAKKFSVNTELEMFKVEQTKLSKEELVSVGYYEAAIAVASGYYNTLDPVEAYNDILNDNVVATYLDDYYNTVVYMYDVKVNG